MQVTLRSFSSLAETEVGVVDMCTKLNAKIPVFKTIIVLDYFHAPNSLALVKKHFYQYHAISGYTGQIISFSMLKFFHFQIATSVMRVDERQDCLQCEPVNKYISLGHSNEKV